MCERNQMNSSLSSWMRLRPKKPAIEHAATAIQSAPHHKKTQVEVMRDYRQRLKENPELYKSHRKSETLRLKLFRLDMSDEQHKRYREKAKERMRRYRERKKAEGDSMPKKAVRLTRAETEKQRSLWRDQKKKQRENMTAQKKRRVNERKRTIYHQKKKALTASAVPTSSSAVPMSSSAVPTTFSDVPTTSSATPSSSGTYSGAAKRKAVSRSLQSMPRHPQRFADVMSSIIQNTTPRKRAALEERLILSPNKKRRLHFLETAVDGIQTTLQTTKYSRSKKVLKARNILRALLKKRNIAISTLRKQFGFSYKFISKSTIEDHYQPRSDSLPTETIQQVQSFYQRGDISREMPMAKLVTKQNMMAKKALESSIKTTFDQFKEEYPESTLSYSKFVKLRPAHVKPMTTHRLMQCLCEYCVNIDLKLSSINMACNQNQVPEATIKHKYNALDITLCPKEGDKQEKKCIDRECNVCGCHQIRNKLLPLTQNHSGAAAKWKKWQTEKYKNKDGKDCSHMILKETNGTVEQLINELEEELKPFSKHLYNAKWQSKQFDNLRNNVPTDWVVFCMDFAENYNCHYQDEAQSAHWSYNQATIHPIVTYYKCPKCDKSMHESLIFISDDRKHDHHAVQHFVTIANRHLLERGLNIEHEVHFSDGSASQYKSKISFSDASFASNDFGFIVEKNFFGSRHGKGPCDGEIGVLKKSASLAVTARKSIISNAEELYTYGKTALTREGEHEHSKRTFFYVKSEDICRNRNDRTNVRSVVGTRSHHAVKGIQSFVVAVKERSCFCIACTSNNGQSCTNTDWTGDWKVVSLKQSQRGGGDGGVPGRRGVRVRLGVQRQNVGGRRGVRVRGATRGQGEVRSRGGVRVRGGAQKQGDVQQRGRGRGRGRSRGRGSGRGCGIPPDSYSSSSDRTSTASPDKSPSSSSDSPDRTSASPGVRRVGCVQEQGVVQEQGGGRGRVRGRGPGKSRGRGRGRGRGRSRGRGRGRGRGIPPDSYSSSSSSDRTTAASPDMSPSSSSDSPDRTSASPGVRRFGCVQEQGVVQEQGESRGRGEGRGLKLSPDRTSAFRDVRTSKSPDKTSASLAIGDQIGVKEQRDTGLFVLDCSFTEDIELNSSMFNSLLEVLTNDDICVAPHDDSSHEDDHVPDMEETQFEEEEKHSEEATHFEDEKDKHLGEKEKHLDGEMNLEKNENQLEIEQKHLEGKEEKQLEMEKHYEKTHLEEETHLMEEKDKHLGEKEKNLDGEMNLEKNEKQFEKETHLGEKHSKETQLEIEEKHLEGQEEKQLEMEKHYEKTHLEEEKDKHLEKNEKQLEKETHLGEKHSKETQLEIEQKHLEGQEEKQLEMEKHYEKTHLEEEKDKHLEKNEKQLEKETHLGEKHSKETQLEIEQKHLEGQEEKQLEMEKHYEKTHLEEETHLMEEKDKHLGEKEKHLDGEMNLEKNEKQLEKETHLEEKHSDDSMLEALHGHVNDGDAYTAQVEDTCHQSQDAVTEIVAELQTNSDPTVITLTSDRPSNDDSMQKALPGHVDDGDAYTAQVEDTCHQSQDIVAEIVAELPTTRDPTLITLTSDRPSNDDSVLEAPPGHVDDGDAYTAQEEDTCQQSQDAVDEIVAEPPTTSDTTVNTLTSNRYHTGDYIIIQHGSTVLPAVVDVWPWVRFFTKKNNTWTINETTHTIVATDVRAGSAPPDIIMRGSRLLYKFKDVLLQ